MANTKKRTTNHVSSRLPALTAHTSFGVKDGQGRLMGIKTVSSVLAVAVGESPGYASGDYSQPSTRLAPGTWFEVRAQATRDEEAFGRGQAVQFFATVTARDAYVAKHIADARKRATRVAEKARRARLDNAAATGPTHVKALPRRLDRAYDFMRATLNLEMLKLLPRGQKLDVFCIDLARRSSKALGKWDGRVVLAHELAELHEWLQEGDAQAAPVPSTESRDAVVAKGERAVVQAALAWMRKHPRPENCGPELEALYDAAERLDTFPYNYGVDPDSAE